MLECEGYKMFYGTARVSGVNPDKFPPRDITGTWLYKPEWNCWYVNGESFPAEIVSNMRGETQMNDSIELTKDEAESLADFIDLNLIQTIRDDTNIDSMAWLKSMIHAYEKLCAYSGYVGLTELAEEEADNG